MISRRGLLTSIAAGALAAACPIKARADLFGGDIGVLLAQLAQQLELVSNAIQTVRGIVATVDRLQNMVKQAEQLGSLVTGKGGLDGFLRGAQGLVDAGRGAVGNLRYLDSVGGRWKDTIIAQGGSLTFDQAIKLTSQANNFDRMMLRDAAKFAEAFGQVTSSFDALRSASEAAREAETALGIVGQAKLLNRQFVQLAGISAQLSGTMSTIGSMQAAHYQGEAARNEAGRKIAEENWDSIKTRVDIGPVEVVPYYRGGSGE